MADAQTIDKLAIEITSSIKGEKKLKNFASALQDLANVSSSINTSNLQSVSGDIKSITHSFEGFSANTVKNFANSLGRLSQIEKGSLSGFQSLSSQLKDLASATSKMDLNGINRLTNSLSRLSNAKMNEFDPSKLGQIASTVRSLAGSLSQVDGVDSSVTRLVGAFAKLGDSGQYIKNVQEQFPKIGKQILTLVTDLKGVGTIDESIAKLVEAIAKLASAGKSIPNVVSNLDKFGDAVVRLVQKLQGVGDISDNLANTIQGLGNMAQGGMKIGSVMQQTATHTSNLGGHLKSLGKIAWNTISPFNSFSEKLGKTKKQSKGLASTIGLLYAKYWLLKRGVQAVGKMTGSAQDYVEAFNYFNVALNKVGEDSKDQFKRFGYDDADSYAQSFQDRFTELQKTMTGFDVNSRTGDLTYTGGRNLGLNIKDVMEYQAQVAQITNSVGQLGEVSIMASKAMSMIAADMSSLTNTDLTQVQENFISGLNGMTRAVYKYGINITSANLQQIAYNHGVSQSVAKLSMASKQQLRLIGMLEQSKVAWGDLNRTLSQPANQLRRLQSGFANLGRTIGSLFLPLLNVVYPVLNAIVSLLQQFFGWLAKLIGVKMPDMSTALNMPDLGGAADDSGELADNTGKAAKNAKKLNDNLQGFDEINKLQAENDASGGGSGGGGGGMGDIDLSKDIADLLAQLEKEWGKKFEDKVAKIAESMKKALLDGWNKGGDFTKLGQAFGRWITNGLKKIPWNKIKNVIKKLVKSVATFLNGWIKGMDWDVLGKTLAEGINTVVEALYTWYDTFDFLEFGKRLAKGISSTIRNIDWDKLGRMLGKKVRGMIQFAFGFITNIDFKELGTKISNAINGYIAEMGKIDPRTGLSGWSELGKSISKAIEGLLDTIITLLDKVDWDAVGEAVADFLGGIDWGKLMLKVGELIVKGIGTAIKVAIKAFAKDPLGMATALVSVLGIIFAYKKLIGFFDAFTIMFGRGMNGAMLRAMKGNTLGAGLEGVAKGGLFSKFKSLGKSMSGAFMAGFSGSGNIFKRIGKGIKEACKSGFKGLNKIKIGNVASTITLVGTAVLAGNIGGKIIGDRVDAYTDRLQGAVDTGKTKGQEKLAIAKSEGKNVNDTYKKELEKSLAEKKKALDEYKEKYRTMIKNGVNNITQATASGGQGGIGYALKSIFDLNKDFSDVEDAEAKIKELEGVIQGMQNTLSKYNGTEERSKQIENSRSKALKKLYDMAKKGKISWYDYCKAQKAVQDSTGKTSDIMGEALLATDKYRGITNKLASDMTKAGVPMEQQKAIMGKLKQAVAEGRLSLEKYQKIVNGAKGDVNKLNEAIKNIPKTKTTKLTISTNIANVRKQLESIQKKITVDVQLKTTVLGGKETTVKNLSASNVIRNYFGGNSSIYNENSGRIFKLQKNGSVLVKEGYGDLAKYLKAAGIKYKIVKKFAKGGYLEDGLFTMNKGEIAGKFDNGKSVVANNQQISDGIAKSLTSTLAPAIYSAVKQGVNDARGDGDGNIKVYLDGKQIAENSVKYIRKMNKSNGRTSFA